MRILLVTVAGISSRFSTSLGGEGVIKCLYNRNGIEESLLYKLLHQPVWFDRYIIVGGYKYEELQMAVEASFADLSDRITLVRNEFYDEYGSGYSLYVGMTEALKYSFDEIVFAEGDLFLDEESFSRVHEANRSVITINRTPILANKAVVLYSDALGGIHYLYDTAHNLLEIKEPFTAVYNSGQVWKFADSAVVRGVYDEMPFKQWTGTNLVFVQAYFEQIGTEKYDIIEFKKWINCNTVTDFEGTRE